MPIDYSQREKSFELYRKGKREGTWDPDDYDLQQDAEDWQSFTEEEQAQFLELASGFYDGEENVTRTLAPYMTALDALDDSEMPFDTVQEEVYLSQQVYEEAKHTDFFSRYYEEVIGTQDTGQFLMQEGDQYETEDLYDQADELLQAVREGDQTELVRTLGMAYLNYMGILEGQRARAGYMVFDQMCESKAIEMGREEVLPGFQTALGKVRQDETRHIENGRWVLQQLADADPDIVTEVYEPRIVQYIQANILSEDIFEEMPFEHYDEEKIGKKTVQHLQDTIDYIGAEKFDRLSDVATAIETMRSEGDAATAAGDDD
jgi:ribonucleoside-diphosphate reductase beta chain